MPDLDLLCKPISELAALIRTGRVSPVEVTRAALARIESLNGRLGAFIAVTAETALSRARAVEAEVRAGKYRGPLHGVPVAVKDLINVRGVPTTAGSRVLAGNVPGEDSTLVQRLDAAGAVLLGKLNLSEFAMGGTIEHPYGTPRNPWNPAHSPGGSSSGSAIAVAAGMCFATLGSDTGGSVRGPAAYCGVVGLRPTYGRVTRHGVVPLSWSMDTVGPLARTVEDCAIVLKAIAGFDPRDPTTARRRVPDYAAALGGDLKGLRVGLPREVFEFEDLDAEMGDAARKAVEVLERLGAVSREVSLPTSPSSGAIGLAISDADAASYHAPWLRTRAADYDPGTRLRLEAGALIPAATYLRAQRARALVRRELLAALEQVDVIATPSGIFPPPLLAPPRPARGDGAAAMERELRRRVALAPPGLAGLPALSVPCGFTHVGLPIGLQLVGRPFDEGLLFKVAHAYEAATEWHTMRPPL